MEVHKRRQAERESSFELRDGILLNGFVITAEHPSHGIGSATPSICIKAELPLGHGRLYPFSNIVRWSCAPLEPSDNPLWRPLRSSRSRPASTRNRPMTLRMWYIRVRVAERYYIHMSVMNIPSLTTLFRRSSRKAKHLSLVGSTLNTALYSCEHELTIHSGQPMAHRLLPMQHLRHAARL